MDLNLKIIVGLEFVDDSVPVIIFAAKLKVGEHDGDFGAGDDEDDEDDEQKTEQVVELVQPDSTHDEEDFNENCAKRQQAAKKRGKKRMHVPARIVKSVKKW